MKLKIDERQSDRDGSLNEKRFNVKTSPQAFKILADNLYSNKDRAVVRELVCNAHDAHVDKFEDKADEISIDLHIPNYLEQWFSIRDYGNGMSHDFMMGEVEVDGEKVGYCTAFHSSKSDSNKQSGLYGLGKLAVLSLTDSYSIISITFCEKTNANIKRFYTVFREKGYPVIVFMGESETKEKTGVEIKVPISNYSAFEREAIGFLSNLDVNFNISGTTLRPKNLEVILNRNTWRVFKRGNSYSSDGVMAKIGIVRYPIANHHLHKDLQCKFLEIDFPVGSLEITPSREALSYDKETIELIKKRSEEIVEEIKEEFNSKLAAAPNLWEARKLIHSLSSGELSQFSSIITDCRYLGKPIYSSIKLPKYSAYKFYTKVSYRKGTNRETLISYTANEITAKDKVVFVINEALTLDKNGAPEVKVQHSKLRIKKYFADNPNPEFYVFSQKDYDELKNTGELEGAPDPIYLSKMPFDPVIRAKSVKGGSKKPFDAGEIYYVDRDGKNYPFRWMDNSILPNEGYYVIAGKNERSSSLCGYNSRYGLKIGFCQTLKIPADYVFAIHPRKEKSFLKAYPNWRPASELDEKIKKELDIRLKGVIVEDTNGVPWEFVKALCDIKELQNNEQIANLKALVDDYSNKNYVDLVNIASFYGISVPKSTVIIDSYMEILNDYPLLHLAGGQVHKISEYKKEWARYLRSSVDI